MVDWLPADEQDALRKGRLLGMMLREALRYAASFPDTRAATGGTIEVTVKPQPAPAGEQEPGNGKPNLSSERGS